MNQQPVLAGTPNAGPYLPLGLEVFRAGGTALDAVERIIREVEADVHEHTVGVGGWPNLVGEVELDASIMDGRDRRTGAVGAVGHYAHPISIARKVMELTPHVLLVGRGAEDFARETGFPEEELLTPEEAGEWEARLRANVPAGDMPQLLARRKLLPYVLLARDPQRIHGTVNVLALDGRGDLASGVSTSGWAWKYPGRLGDSPVIGAGNYCDSRYGAAACSGHGELAIRASLARSIVLHMENGASPEEACARALRDLPGRDEPGSGVVVAVAMDRRGRHCSATSSAHGWGYVFMSAGMAGPESRPPSPIG
jgi:beta-aspartyl-peptidase (threonine type)